MSLLSLSSISSRTLFDQQEDGESYADSSVMVNPSNLSLKSTTMGANKITSRLAKEQESYIGSLGALHLDFLSAIQEMNSPSEILQVMANWKDSLKDKLLLERLADSAIPDDVYEKLQLILSKEQQTWDLIIQLCSFRYGDFDMEEEHPFTQTIYDEFHFNEFQSVRSIANSERAIKECSLILSWLESHYGLGSYDPDLASKPMMWEQTLQVLKRDKLLSKPSESIVKHLDPDATTRENKQLHPLDAEEETKVMKGAYFYLRQGNQEKSKDYLQASGHHLKAGVLFGGGYTSMEIVDENEFVQHALDYIGVAKDNLRYFDAKMTFKPGVFSILRGNRTRDLWKKTAWNICESKGQSKYERACLGSLCGHRQSMLDVSRTWEDKLWAYLKTSLDVKIEERLRCHTEPNNYIELPEEYWAQGLTLSECFNRLEDRVSSQAEAEFPESIFRVVQKNVMTEDISVLLQHIEQNLSYVLQNQHPLLQEHRIRFLTHLLLALGVLDLGFNEGLNNAITEAYIKVLVRGKRFAYIPFYVQKLTESRQIQIIVEQLDVSTVHTDEIKFFLSAAHANSLDVLSIGTAVVEKLRLEQEDFEIKGLLWVSSCYEYVADKGQVMLTFLKFILILTRKYLALENVAKVKQLLKEVNSTCLTEVGGISENYSETLVREYICYMEYMEAEENLKMWTRSMSLKPDFDGGSLHPAATLSDKALWETKRREFEENDRKWKKSMEYHMKTAITKLMDVLRFPGGWLMNCCSEENSDDLFHINSVRCITIKKVTFILLKLLQERKSVPLFREFVTIMCNKRLHLLKEFMKPEIGTVFKTVDDAIRKRSKNLIILPK